MNRAITEEEGRIYGRFKTPKIRSPKHLKWVATNPCFLTGMRDGAVVGHHLLLCGGHGIATKEDDSLTLPLTAMMHDKLHRAGDEIEFFKLFNYTYLDVLGFIREMNKQSPCHKIRASEAVDRAIERQKRIEGI